MEMWTPNNIVGTHKWAKLLDSSDLYVWRKIILLQSCPSPLHTTPTNQTDTDTEQNECYPNEKYFQK